MASIGMLSLLAPSTNSPLKSTSNMPDHLRGAIALSPGLALRRFFFGVHEKTKRTLAEEAECGDETSLSEWIRDGIYRRLVVCNVFFHPRSISILFAKGSDPNECDAYGYTPLLNAAALGRLSAVEELIKNGANIDLKGPYGFSALHAAAQVNILNLI